MPKFKDSDFLYLSTLVKAMEEGLFTGEQYERLLTAESDADLARVLEERGLTQVDVRDIAAVDKALNARMGATLTELANRSPDPRIMDIFRMKYDYHNAKVLLKAEQAGVEGGRLLSRGGRIAPEVFAERYVQGVTLDIPLVLSKAMKEAKDTLARTKDAQMADVILDRAMYEEYFQLAKELDDRFLESYIRDMIDATNLRTAVRAGRMGLDTTAVMALLVPGGATYTGKIAEAQSLEMIYAGTVFEAAAAAGQSAISDGSLTLFERLCDEALGKSLKKAKLIAFGVAPVVAYLAALEAEAMAIRIILSGKSAGLEAEAIRERLRAA